MSETKTEPTRPETDTPRKPALARPITARRKPSSGVIAFLRNSPRRMMDWATGERMVDFLKTLAWVAPLTVLIWVYAEREQTEKLTEQIIPIAVKSTNPNRVVRLESPADANLIATLTGPNATLRAVSERIRTPSESSRITIEINDTLSPNRRHEIPSGVVANDSLFTSNAIEVTEMRPATLTIYIDEIKEERATVVAPPSAARHLQGPAVFNPSYVVLRGPSEKLNRARDEEGQLLVQAVFSPQDLQTPTDEPREVKAVPLRLPVDDSEITFVDRTAVDATIRVKAADASYKLRTMPIHLDVLDGFIDEHDVQLDEPLLFNVTLIGPPDLIEAIQRDDSPAKPHAVLSVGIDDVQREGLGKPFTKKLKFDLGLEGVRVSPEDANRTVEVRITRRGGQ